MSKYVLGKDLHVGDTIAVWWSPNRDTIIGLKPYTGPLLKYFKRGASIAEFAISSVGMTIDHNESYEIVARTRVRTLT